LPKARITTRERVNGLESRLHDFIGAIFGKGKEISFANNVLKETDAVVELIYQTITTQLTP
jgi:hypothetical protein